MCILNPAWLELEYTALKKLFVSKYTFTSIYVVEDRRAIKSANGNVSSFDLFSTC